ncbi:MAG: DUF11 domain-containing protein [Deltaproteobacteria bacterium]|nr:DUF11 domain-containing protein [Deltaproteobacteria bacterium]
MSHDLLFYVLRVALTNTIGALVFVLVTASTIHAGVNRWTAIGPEGGSVTAFVIDPQTPTTIYIGISGSGVFKSNNSGAHWRPANAGLEDNAIHTIVIDPHAPAILYAATFQSVFKSTNGGASWAPMNNGFPDQFVGAITALAIDPLTPTTLYAGTTQGLFKSADGAANWTRVNSPSLLDTDIRTLALDPTNPRILYVGTFHFFPCGEQRPPCSTPSAFKSNDGDQSWQQINLDIATVANNEVRFVFAASGLVYAYNAGGILKSADGGTSWILVSQSPTDDGYIISLAIAPTLPQTLLLGTSRGAFRSTDEGQSWSRFGTNADMVNIVTPDIGPSTFVYLGTDNGVVKVSSDGTVSTRLNSGLRTKPILQFAVEGNSSTLYATSGSTLFTSTNNGETWVESVVALESALVTRLVIAPTVPPSLYAVVDSRSSPFPPSIVKSVDGGKTWTTIFSDTWFSAFTVDPMIPTTLYLIAIPSSRTPPQLQKSIDGGNHWTTVSFLSDLSGTFVLRLAIHPRTPSLIYATTAKGVFTSTDGGASWNFLTSAVIGGTLVFDPQTPTTIYAFGEQFARSVDGGMTWTSLDAAVRLNPEGNYSVISAFAIDPLNSKILYIGLNGEGVYRSTDAGASWATLNSGLVNKWVTALTINPLIPNTLYATVGNGSAFALDMGSESADLSITQSDIPDPVQTGDPLTYTFVVTNNGPSTATEVTIRNTLPRDMTLVSAIHNQGTCRGQHAIACDLGTLGIGKTATLALVVKPKISGITGEVRNIATVSGLEPDPRTDNNTAVVVTTVVAAPGPDLVGFWNPLKEKCKGSEELRRCTIKGSLVVKNQGVRDAIVSSFSFRISVFGVSSWAGPFNIPALKAGKKMTIKINFSLPPGASMQGQALYANVDPHNELLEMNEQNNGAISQPIR